MSTDLSKKNNNVININTTNNANVTINNNNLNINQNIPNNKLVTDLTTPTFTTNNILSQLIIELTSNQNMSLLIDHWRKSESYLLLLYNICHLGWPAKWLLNKREVIAQLIDTFLGEQSPLLNNPIIIHNTTIANTTNNANNATTSRSTRMSHCPSSFVLVGPCLKSGELPSVAKTIPDWTILIKIINLLVISSKPDSYQSIDNTYSNTYSNTFTNTNNTNSSFPEFLRFQNMDNFPYLSSLCKECIKSRVFIATVFRQARYTELIYLLIIHQCYKNLDYSNLIIEVVFDTISIGTYESAAHLFQILDVLINIDDNFQKIRAESMTKGPSGLFTYMFNIKDQTNKAKDFNIYLYSSLHLILKYHLVFKSVLASPTTNMNNWVPWMLKAAYQYQEKVRREVDLGSVISASILDQQQTTTTHMNTTTNNSYNDIENNMRAGCNSPLTTNDVDNTTPISSSHIDTDSLQQAGLALQQLKVPHDHTCDIAVDTTNKENKPVNKLTIDTTNTTTLAALTTTTNTTATINNTAINNTIKGPYLIVYGDQDNEKESTWQHRAETTFNLLNTVITTFDGNPDSFVTDDMFLSNSNNNDIIEMETDSLPDLVSADDLNLALALSANSTTASGTNLTSRIGGTAGTGTGDSSSSSGGVPMVTDTVPVLPAASLGDAMTDEEFQKYLSDMSNFM